MKPIGTTLAFRYTGYGRASRIYIVLSEEFLSRVNPFVHEMVALTLWCDGKICPILIASIGDGSDEEL